MLQEMRIEVPGTDSGSLFVEALSGREAICETFEFVIDVVSGHPLELRKSIGRHARIEVRNADEVLAVTGLISSATAHDAGSAARHSYRFMLVPDLEALALSSHNQVYGAQGDMTVIDILDAELKGDSKANSRTGENRVAHDIPFEMLAGGASYPALSFVMQYRESDLNFFNRLCEKFGIFYYFSESGGATKLIVGDRKEHFRPLADSGGSDFRFRPWILDATDHSPAVRELSETFKIQTGCTLMREYNEENPKVDLLAARSSDLQPPELNKGAWTYYAENYSTAEDGAFLATRRSQIAEANQRVLAGTSDIPQLRPGFVFRLEDNPFDADHQQYIVTAVEHDAAQPVPIHLGGSGMESNSYQNRFACVPFETGFRPRLKTRKPEVSGLLIAKIDGDGSRGKAAIDDQGRYRVRILDAECPLSDTAANHWVRKIEPYGGGDGIGAHSILLSGTEVILGFLHGDPDRPIMLGAVHNGEQTSPAVEHNSHVEHRTRTTSGIVIEYGSTT